MLRSKKALAAAGGVGVMKLVGVDALTFRAKEVVLLSGEGNIAEAIELLGHIYLCVDHLSERDEPLFALEASAEIDKAATFCNGGQPPLDGIANAMKHRDICR